MTIQTLEFIDITGADAGKAPFVKGGLRLYYATGSSGIEATAAEIAAARAAGMTILLYDQTPSLSLFAAGIAHIAPIALADVEAGAGTIATVDAAVKLRQSRGEASVVYCSYSALAGIKRSLSSLVGVSFGVADYSWSLASAIALLGANPDWAYCQFGDPNSNPHTVVPGTTVTLAQCNADINVGKVSWAAPFMQPPAPPVPKPVEVTQNDWRWCSKCQVLFFGPNEAVSKCIAGGTHDGSTSGNYSLSDLP